MDVQKKPETISVWLLIVIMVVITTSSFFISFFRGMQDAQEKKSNPPPTPTYASSKRWWHKVGESQLSLRRRLTKSLETASSLAVLSFIWASYTRYVLILFHRFSVFQNHEPGASK